jgi:hypothetical protein
MFFNKGLRDPALICKLTMKNPKTSEAMFIIASKYALDEEATLNTRKQKKEKKLSHADQPLLSKGHDKREKWIIMSIWWNGRDTTRSTGPGRVNLKASWITSSSSTPRESTRPKTVTDSKGSQMKFSRQEKGQSGEKA